MTRQRRRVAANLFGTGPREMRFRATPEVQWALAREQARSGRSLSYVIREAILVGLAQAVFKSLEEDVAVPDFSITMPAIEDLDLSGFDVDLDLSGFDVDLEGFDPMRHHVA